jgi:hypothetical protein
MRRLIIGPPYPILFGDQIENVVGWACSMYGGGESRGVYRVLVGTPEGKSQA